MSEGMAPGEHMESESSFLGFFVNTQTPSPHLGLLNQNIKARDSGI